MLDDWIIHSFLNHGTQSKCFQKKWKKIYHLYFWSLIVSESGIKLESQKIFIFLLCSGESRQCPRERSFSNGLRWFPPWLKRVDLRFCCWDNFKAPAYVCSLDVLWSQDMIRLHEVLKYDIYSRSSGSGRPSTKALLFCVSMDDVRLIPEQSGNLKKQMRGQRRKMDGLRLWSLVLNGPFLSLYSQCRWAGWHEDDQSRACMRCPCPFFAPSTTVRSL